MKPVVVIEFILFYLILLIVPLRAGEYPPGLKWYTLETEHFYIYYPEDLKEVAQKIGFIAEDVYEKLVPFMRWMPDRKVDVVLNDFTDLANGFTTFVPSNRIELFLTPPPLESQLNNYNDWLYLLFTHEFTHTLHIDQNGGIASLSRYLFGRFYYSPAPFLPSIPVVFFPSWIHESIAVYNETLFTGKGRGNSPYTDMVIFTALLEHNFPTLAQLITPPPSWPDGYIPYIFGEEFLKFLINRHGKEALYRSFRLERNYIFPFWEEILHFFSFHTPMEADWNAWKRYLFDEAEERGFKLRRRGVKFISPPQWGHSSPVCMGGKVYYVEISGYRERRLILYDPLTGSRKVLIKGKILPYLTTDGRYLYYSKIDFFERHYLFSDLYLYDPLKGTEKRLTWGKRLKYPVSDGKFIYALKVTWKGVWLVKISFDGSVLDSYRIPGADNAAFLIVDRKGDRLIFSVHKEGSVVIESFDPSNGEFHDITDEGWIDLYPGFTPEGDIIFSSSRGNKGFNLFMISDGKIIPVTRGFGGYFKSCFLDKRHIIVDLYTSRGFRVAEMKVRKGKKRKLQKKVTEDFSSPAGEGKVFQPSGRYNPFSHLSPAAVFPEISYSPVWKWRAGFELKGGDPLNFVSYDFQIDRKMSFNTTDFSGWIVLSRFDPDIAAGGGILSIPADKSGKRAFVKKKFFTFQMLYNSPSLNDISKAIVFTYSFASTSTEEGGARVTFQYSTVKSYPEIWRLNDGFYAGLSLISYSPFLGSPYNTAGVITDFRDYFSILPDVLGRFEVYGGITGGDGRKDLKITPGENAYKSDPFYYSVPSENSFNFYGYLEGEIKAYTLGAFSTSLDFRVWRINDGFGALPFWIGEVWATFFTQHVFSASKKFSIPDEYHGNVGTSFTFNFVAGHLIPFYIKFVVTYRIPDGKTLESFYVSFYPL